MLQPTPEAEPSHGFNRRSVLRAGVGLGATGMVLASASEAAAQPRGSHELRPADIAALYRLKAEYAFGTDAITSGDFDRGLALYRRVFTARARITAGFDPASPLLEATGPDEWAEAVRGTAVGTLGSQHLIGTTTFEPGEARWRAAITTHFQATVLSATDNAITTYLGTYHDEARRTGAGWRLTSSFSKYFSIEVGTRAAP
jgi:hypothetical protein